MAENFDDKKLSEQIRWNYKLKYTVLVACLGLLWLVSSAVRTGEHRQILRFAQNDILNERVRRCRGFFIVGYVVMPEHAHLMSEPERAGRFSFPILI